MGASFGSRRSFAESSASRVGDGDASDLPAALIALCAAAFFVSLLIGPSYILWLFFLVPLVFAAPGAPRAMPGNVPKERVAHLGLPIELHLVAKDTEHVEVDDAAVPRPPRHAAEMPTLYVQVSAMRNFERFTIEGYSFWRLPTRAGAYERRVRTWRPVGRVRDQLQDFFLGGAQRLADVRYSQYPPDEWHANPDRRTLKTRFVSKFGFLTERGGDVSLRCHVLEQQQRQPQQQPVARAKADAATAATAQQRATRLRGAGEIDAILDGLRSNLRHGSAHSDTNFDKDKSRSAKQRAAELIHKLESEREQQRRYRTGAFVGLEDDASNSQTYRAGVEESKDTR